MANINEVIFSKTRAEKKVEIIKSLTENELFDVKFTTIQRIAKELANDYGYHGIARERREGNEWNSVVDRMDYDKKSGEVTLEVYVQNDSTDSMYFEDVHKFLNSSTRDYVEYFDYLDTRVRYDRTDRSKVIKSILLEYVYYKWIEKPEREKQALIAKYKNMGRKTYDDYYEKHRLWYIDIDKRFSSNSSIIAKEGYHEGINYVEKWLNMDDNYKTLNDKTDDEIKSIIKDKFYEGVKDYKEHFDRNEYFKNWI